MEHWAPMPREWVHDEGVPDLSFLQSSVLPIFQQVLVRNNDVYSAWPSSYVRFHSLLRRQRGCRFQGGPGIAKTTRGGFFFLRGWQPPPPPITCYSKKNIAFFVFSTNISQYLTLKKAPGPYVHVFVCGYGSHSANPLMHAWSQSTWNCCQKLE